MLLHFIVNLILVSFFSSELFTKYWQRLAGLLHSKTKLNVLAQATIIKYPRPGGLNTTHLFLKFWRLGSPRSGAGRLGSGWRLTSRLGDSCLLTRQRERARERSGVCLIGHWSHHEVLPSWPNHLPKPTPPNAITLGGRASYSWIWGGGHNSVHSTKPNKKSPKLCQLICLILRNPYWWLTL